MSAPRRPGGGDRRRPPADAPTPRSRAGRSSPTLGDKRDDGAVGGRAAKQGTPSPRPVRKAERDEILPTRGVPARSPRSASSPRVARPASPAPKPRPSFPRSTADQPPLPPAPEPHRSGEPQRIAKLLARAGIASRREVERMIADRRVALNGQPLDTPATILTSLAGISVDGKPVAAPEAARLFLFHKPTGLLTTAHDPAGRPTIYDRLPPELPRVVPVGRLDMNTEGLLLLTTDGGLKRQLELPASGVPRVYRARVYGEVRQDALEALIEGITIDGMRYGPIDANMERRTGRNGWIELRLTEGKNREVRRVLEHLELQVSRLIRVAYGPFVLADLAPGGIVEVRAHDLAAFRQTLR